MEIVEATPLAAWRAAAAHLISRGGEDFHVLLEFPMAGAHDEQPLRDYDPRTVLGAKYDLARDVANTIFPSKTRARSNSRRALYDRYLKINARRKHGRWGTYFERMIAFGPEPINQLERVIHALNTWRNSPKAALQLHLSSASTDALRPLGAPCLQYIQFCCPRPKALSLTAVFRNHDYCNKVLGNLFGLSRLLGFVAAETTREPLRVSSLSIHAYADTSLKKLSRLAKLD